VVNKGIATAGKVPTLVEYQDYQCPICKEYGSFYGTVLNKMSAEGSIILEYRTMTFMDSNLSNTASSRVGRGGPRALTRSGPTAPTMTRSMRSRRPPRSKAASATPTPISGSTFLPWSV